MTTPIVDPGAQSSGVPIPSSRLTNLRNNDLALARPPACTVLMVGGNISGAGAWSSINFTAADLRDTDNIHSPTVNPSRFTVPAGMGGWWTVIGWASLAANSTGLRWCRLLVNGSIGYDQDRQHSGLSSSYGPRLKIGDEILLGAGDYVEVQLSQNSGVNLALECRLTLRLVAWA